MSLENFKQKSIASASRGFLVAARLSCILSLSPSLVLPFYPINYACIHVYIRVVRLVRQAPEAMSSLCVQWSPLVYPLLLHLNPKLRERAVVAMDTLMPTMMAQQMDVARCLASDLKDVRPPTNYRLCTSQFTHGQFPVKCRTRPLYHAVVSFSLVCSYVSCLGFRVVFSVKSQAPLNLCSIERLARR